jgi:hypothetical protein
MSREDEAAKNDRLFDSRTIERNIRKGLITRKDYDKHLKGLPDATDKIAPPEAPRSYAQSSPAAAVDVDHLDAGLDDDDEDQVRHVTPPEGQRAAGEGDEEIVDGDEDDLEDDIEDDDEDEVDTDPPKN